MGRLNGVVAFITGAGGGIGSAICQRFLEEGACVAAADFSPSASLAKLGEFWGNDRLINIHCDVSDSESVSQAIRLAVESYGVLNNLCNVAGGSSPRDGNVIDVHEDEFWRAIKVDLFGTFLCCKHGIPELIKSGGGAVINMTSMVALTAVPDRDCYTAAKGGVAALTRSMALEFANKGVRVNAIAPGITTTPRVQSMIDGSLGESALVTRHLLGLVSPLDVADMAVYLASTESRVVTGQILRVDSGVTVC